MYYSQPATVSIIMERIDEFRIEWLNTDWQESNKTESQKAHNYITKWVMVTRS